MAIIPAPVGAAAITPKPLHVLLYLLGNYTHPNTRHSLAQFLIPSLLAGYNLPPLELERRYQSYISTGIVRLPAAPKLAKGIHRKKGEVPGWEGEFDMQVTIVKPRLLMNILGPLVPPLLSSYPSTAARPTLLVLHDSLSANPMSIVVPRTNVSAQGHNGLRSCESSLKTKDYWRMGLGIGRPQGSGKGGVSEWVLGKLSLDERIYWEGEGVQKVMSEIEGWARKRIVE